MDKIVKVLKVLKGSTAKKHPNHVFGWVLVLDGIAVACDSVVYVEIPTEDGYMCAVNVSDRSYPKDAIFRIAYKQEKAYIVTPEGEEHAQIPNFEDIKPDNLYPEGNKFNINVGLMISRIKGYEYVKIKEKFFLVDKIKKIFDAAKKMKIEELECTFYDARRTVKFHHSDTLFYALIVEIMEYQTDSAKTIEI